MIEIPGARSAFPKATLSGGSLKEAFEKLLKSFHEGFRFVNIARHCYSSMTAILPRNCVIADQKKFKFIALSFDSIKRIFASIHTSRKLANLLFRS